MAQRCAGLLGSNEFFSVALAEVITFLRTVLQEPSPPSANDRVTLSEITT